MPFLGEPRYPPLVTIHPWCRESMAGPAARNAAPSTMSLDTLQSLFVPGANRAVFIPFTLDQPTTFVKMAIFGTTAGNAGNVDVGVYTEDGTRLWSSGSTTMLTDADSVQEFSINSGAGIRLGPGRFRLAVVFSSGSAQVYGTFTDSNSVRLHGLANDDSMFPLPAAHSMDYNSVNNNTIPAVMLTTRSQI